MLLKIKNLSMLNKILFFISLLLLFIWVIPTMISYYKDVQQYDIKNKELQSISMKNDISGEAKVFNTQEFKTEMEELFSSVNISSLKDNRYEVNIAMDRGDIEKFNKFLETLSLRYLVKVVGPLNFEEKSNKLEVNFTVETL